MSLRILLLFLLCSNLSQFASSLVGTASPVSWQRITIVARNGHIEGSCPERIREPKHADHNKDDDDDDCDYSKIRKGEIYVQEHFLTPAQVDLLRKDIAQLQQQHQHHQDQQQSTETDKETTFRPSGLSNRVAGDRNEFGSSDRLTCTITPDLVRGNTTLSDMRLLVEEKLEALKIRLQEDLFSPLDPQNVQLELAEMYYSVSPKGSHLPRHQDERHEETKGNKGWINDTRRSISWLIYLNEDGWGETATSSERKTKENLVAISTKEKTPNTPTSSSTAKTQQQQQQAAGKDRGAGLGGELRAYVRKCCADQGLRCGSHDGNLQVGWLRRTEWPTSSPSVPTQDRIEYDPVFLDCWVKTPAETTSTSAANAQEEECLNDALEWQTMSALYRIQRKGNSSKPNNRHNKKPFLRHESEHKSLREYLSPPFGPNSPSWPSDSNLDPSDFASALRLQLSDRDHKRRFVGVEDVASACEIVDVLPKGGTLVLFDSVAVPHEVLEVTKGNRLAIAGWYHEAQQEFPEWYGT